MNNKIEGLPSAVARPSTATPSKSQAGPSSAASAPPAGGSDSVSLSEAAIDLAAISRQLSAAPAVDAAKVAAVRSALESGSYEVDAREIARRLLQQESELLRGGQE